MSARLARNAEETVTVFAVLIAVVFGIPAVLWTLAVFGVLTLAVFTPENVTTLVWVLVGLGVVAGLVAAVCWALRGLGRAGRAGRTWLQAQVDRVPSCESGGRK